MTDPRDPRDGDVTGALSPQPRIERMELLPPEVPTPTPRARWQGLPSIESVSLRTRLLGILIVALLVALGVTGYGVQVVLRSYLVQQIDDELRANYDQLSGSPDNRFLNNLVSGYGPPTAFSTYLSVDGRPDLDHVSRGRPGTSPPTFGSMTSAQAREADGRVFTLQSTDGRIWRAVAFPVGYRVQTLQDGQPTQTLLPAAVVMALPTQGVTDALNELRFGTLVLGLSVILLVCFLGWLAIRRSFRPLVEVEETAAAIAAGDLSRRIPERPSSTEVGRLTSSLNGMLTQIESAFRQREASEARTRRFAADASHELRTPLVSIRGFAELYRQGAVPVDEVPRTMRRIEDEAKRLGSLVEDLLLLARLDEQRPGRHEPVDLAVLANDAVHDARGLDAARPVALAGLNGHGPQPAVVTGDEDRLRQVVANLVANAVRHTPGGTAIEVAVGRDAGAAVLEVRDHGHGLTPEQAQRVFERFYRVDSSRRRGTGGGSGLGLSIVAAVVAAHGGGVQVLPTPGGGATFRVVLPGRRDDAPSAWASPSGATSGGAETAVTPR